LVNVCWRKGEVTYAEGIQGLREEARELMKCGSMLNRFPVLPSLPSSRRRRRNPVRKQGWERKSSVHERTYYYYYGEYYYESTIH
jgi:hypothetical protein